MLSVIAAALDATLLDSAEELMGATELAGVELGAAELAGVELGATELAAVELGTGDGAGLLPPPPPPQAVSPSRTMGRAQVLIRDCMIIEILRCCYRELYWSLEGRLGGGLKAQSPLIISLLSVLIRSAARI